ncbi:MAG: hypothetical protein JST42_28015 [Bacteroidetes bacterium]|nr:hypothetical protein [Bacteroidota bacterium]
MAVPRIEVRYRKKAFYLFIAIAILPMALTGYAVVSARPSWLLFLPCLVAFVVVFFVFRRLILMTRSETPVLIFESHALTVNFRRPRTIPWSSITGWKIRTYKANDTLVIRTGSGKISVQLTWLDVPAREIKMLMETYIREPGPGGFRR